MSGSRGGAGDGLAARPDTPALPASGFGAFVARARAAGALVVQPRMGMADPLRMRDGLRATRNADAVTVGTITLDSYTRTGDLAAARRALAEGSGLNGYPIATHSADTTRTVLRSVADGRFPVQVRHGSAVPEHIVRALLAVGLDATEGGPVSYCLPYSRTPLREAVAGWRRGCELLASAAEFGAEPHLETFGGCLMGQLCPPSLLIAVSVLEALFFRQHGLRAVSLSYAQQADPRQDEEALTVLGRLARELLPDVEHHVVLYAYMGVFPRTPGGATLLLQDAARLAVRAGAARLIVKTTAEAHRIPTVGENVRALETAAAAAAAERARPATGGVPGTVGDTGIGDTGVGDTGIEAEARALIGAVLELDADIGRALIRAFAAGYLDVPYCLHPDNAGRARSSLAPDGRLHWSNVGSMPIAGLAEGGPRPPILGSAGLLSALSHVQRTYDARAAVAPDAARPDAGAVARVDAGASVWADVGAGAETRIPPGTLRTAVRPRTPVTPSPPGTPVPPSTALPPGTPRTPRTPRTPLPLGTPRTPPAPRVPVPPAAPHGRTTPHDVHATTRVGTRHTMTTDRLTAAAPIPDPGRHLTAPTTRSALRIQHHLLLAARGFLREQGFTELLPPIIGPVTDPGSRGSKQVDVDFYGHRYKLMTSAILYKQASLLAFDKIFCIAPNVRLEPLETAGTSRHLAEFHQLDVEMAGATRDDAVRLVEELVVHMVGSAISELPKEFAELGRDVDAFTELLKGSFARIRHAEAVAELRGLGHPQSRDAELDWDGEALLSAQRDRPFFVTDYPKGSRGFYDRESPEQPGLLCNFDLIAAEGYGELCSGSRRTNDYAEIVTRMRETGENPQKYRWYLDLVREGVPGSAGFGIGVERLTRYVAGLDAVWQASAFPKVAGVVSP